MTGRIRYGFPAWARANVDPCTPAEVTRYFADRGVEHTKEFWRKLLRGEESVARLETWRRICDATGEPLSTFLVYEPAGEPPAPSRRPTRKKTRKGRDRSASVLPPPPDPRTFFGRP